jgi:chloramphenicol O-acetyltransferase type B
MSLLMPGQRLLPNERPRPPWVVLARSISRSYRYARHKFLLGKRLKCGRNVVFGRGCEFHGVQFVRLGDNVYFGPQTTVETNLDFGSDIGISSRVAFVGNDHDFEDPACNALTGRRLPLSTVKLEGDNAIGFGSILLGNVTIGKGCIVGAGSLVTTDLPPYTFCVGVPARPVRRRFAIQTDKYTE